MTVVKDTAPRPLRGLSVLSTDPESFVNCELMNFELVNIDGVARVVRHLIAGIIPTVNCS